MSRISLKSTASSFVRTRTRQAALLALGILLAGCGQAGQSAIQAPATSGLQTDSKASLTPAASLPPPTDLAVTATGAAQVALSWEASSGASDYYVYYGTTSGGETTKSAAIVSTSATITGLNEATTYYFVVEAYSHASGVASAPSNEVSATTTAVLPAPTGLQATAVAAGQVALSWSAASGASDYYVYYGTASGEETTKSAAIVNTSTTLSGLNGATTYYFVVKAYNHSSGITSPASNEVSTITPLAAPANLTATPGNAQATLSWTGSPGASDYYVYSTPAGGATTKSAAIVSTSTTITGLANGTAYSFYVEAYNHPNAITSPASNKVSAMPSSGGSSSSSSGGTASSSSSSGGASSSSGSSSSSSGGASSSSSSSSSSGASSSGATASYWIPYSAAPTASGGTTGIFLVPSNNPSAPPTFLTNSNIDFGVYLEQYLTDNGNIAQTVLSRAFYLTDNGVNDHIYTVELSNTSSIPTPAQVGSFTLSGSDDFVCNFTAFNQTLNTPSNAIILLQMPGQNGCWMSGAVFYLAHADDSITTAPTLTPIAETAGSGGITTGGHLDSPTNVWPVYDGTTGNLSGLVYIDANQNLTFSNQTFTQPVVLLTGVTTFTPLQAQNGFLFIEAATNSKRSLYRVTATGSISQDLYDFQASSGFETAIDAANGNLWLAENLGTNDEQGLQTAYSINLIRVALAATAPAQLIYSVSGTLPAKFFYSYGSQLLGVTGSDLVFTLGAPGAFDMPSSLDTLSATAPPGTMPNSIVTLADGFFGGGYISNEMLFLDSHVRSGITAEVFDLAGNMLMSIAKSQYLGINSRVSGTLLAPINCNPNFYVAEGYTATPPDIDGATVYALSTSDLSQQVLSLPNGSNYVLGVIGPDENQFLFSDGPTVSPNLDGSPVDIAAALDTVNNIWIPFSNPENTEQQPLPEGGGGL